MASKKQIRPSRVVLGALTTAALGGLSWGALTLSIPPSVQTLAEPPFIVATSNEPYGSVWLNVTTSRPFSTDSPSERVELIIDVFGEVDSTVNLALGGPLATTNPKCAGPAFDVRSMGAPAGSALRVSLVEYFQRRPGTGALPMSQGETSLSREDAEAQADRVVLMGSENVVLTDVSARSWRARPSDDPRSYDLATARLICTVDRAAVTTQWLYRNRFRAPDLVASSSSVSPDDLVKVMYRIETASPHSFSTWGSTFDETSRSVDTDGNIVATYTDDWWSSSREGYSGVALNGGSVVWEASGFTLARNWCRLAAGLMASLTVAVASATLVYVARSWRWTSL